MQRTLAQRVLFSYDKKYAHTHKRIRISKGAWNTLHAPFFGQSESCRKQSSCIHVLLWSGLHIRHYCFKPSLVEIKCTVLIPLFYCNLNGCFLLVEGGCRNGCLSFLYCLDLSTGRYCCYLLVACLVSNLVTCSIFRQFRFQLEGLALLQGLALRI